MPSVRVWVDAEEEKKLKELEFLENWGDIHFVRIHDVGQGNSNALHVLPLDGPVLYFDVGCGAIFNAHTCPADGDLKYDFSEKPWIILSHWDFDHWWAGYNQKWAEASQCQWLAPRQKVSPLHQRVALDLDDHLRLWPIAGVGHFRRKIKAVSGADLIEITRCSGDAEGDRNDSGLAVTIKKTQFDEDEQELDNPDLVLLPGDAPYDQIPHLPQGEWIGLVATHHGSRTNMLDGADQPIDEVPAADVATCPVIVYSYGPGNGYGHPNRAAVDGYGIRNWQTDPDQEKDANDRFCLRYDTADNGGHNQDQEIDFDFEK
jgi:hypothetical protein